MLFLGILMIKLPVQIELSLFSWLLSHNLELIILYKMRLQEGVQTRSDKGMFICSFAYIAFSSNLDKELC